MRRRLSADDALPFFSFDVHFGEIMAGGGFDLVLGNPPWVRGERLPASSRTLLARRYRTFRAVRAWRRAVSRTCLTCRWPSWNGHGARATRGHRRISCCRPNCCARVTAEPLRAMLRDTATVIHLEDRSHVTANGFGATVFPDDLRLSSGATRSRRGGHGHRRRRVRGGDRRPSRHSTR